MGDFRHAWLLSCSPDTCAMLWAFIKGTGGPSPLVKRRIEMWVNICSTAYLAESVPLRWRKSRKQVYFTYDMGTFGKRSRGEGNKLFLEYSATRSVQLPPLPKYEQSLWRCLLPCALQETGMFQRTVDTMPRKCLSYKCCTIKKFFFCSSLALCCSVGQLFWWAENGTLAPC